MLQACVPCRTQLRIEGQARRRRSLSSKRRHVYRVVCLEPEAHPSWHGRTAADRLSGRPAPADRSPYACWHRLLPPLEAASGHMARQVLLLRNLADHCTLARWRARPVERHTLQEQLGQLRMALSSRRNDCPHKPVRIKWAAALQTLASAGTVLQRIVGCSGPPEFCRITDAGQVRIAWCSVASTHTIAC